MTHTEGHEPQITYLMERIRRVYAQHAPTGGTVYIADIRPEVGGNRQLQDEALRQLAKNREIILLPESDQKWLQQYHWDGAIEYGNETRHGLQFL